MRNNVPDESGGAKKFLYTGPKKDNDDQEDLPWNFNAKSSNKSSGMSGGSFGVDDVWSIKRNVNLKGGVKDSKPEPLTFNTNKSYYSRYGESSKDKDEFGSSINTTGTNGQSDTKAWGASSQSRRPFSYAYSSDQMKEEPVSPRNVSNSSAAVYPQSGSSFQQTSNKNINSYNQSGSVNSFNQSGVANTNGFDQSGSGNNNNNSNIFGHSGNSSNNDLNQFNGSGSNSFSQSGNSNTNNSNQSSYSVSQGPSWRSSLQNQAGGNSSTSNSLNGGSLMGKGERTGAGSMFNKSSSTNFTGQSHPRTMNSLFASTTSQSNSSRHSSLFQSNNKKSEFESDTQGKSFW